LAINKSKIKGTKFENKIAKLFTEHFGVPFRRTPLSGALEYIKGDVWPPKFMHVWPYVIECKHYKELNFNSLLTAKSNDIWGFWEETLEEAKIMEMKPLLIFKWDRSKDFVMWNDHIEVDTQMFIKAFDYEVKLAELSKWLPQIKLK